VRTSYGKLGVLLSNATALNRLYYALYHTVTALLLTTGVEPRRHRALPGLLGTPSRQR
jgi:uncharacterized protein (UPF0332 family)